MGDVPWSQGMGLGHPIMKPWEAWGWASENMGISSYFELENHRKTIGKPEENDGLMGFDGIYPPVNQDNYGKPQFLLVKLTINGHFQ